MTVLRRFLVAICVLLSGVAYALTPGERILLFQGIKPVWQVNFLSAAPYTWSWNGSAWASNPAGLTYLGASNKTMFDSTGTLTYAPNNLLTYSNTFTDGAWQKFNGGITATGVSDPFGGTSASTFTATSQYGDVYTTLQYPPGTYIARGYARIPSGTRTYYFGEANDRGNRVAVTVGSTWAPYYAVLTLTGTDSVAYFQDRATSGFQPIDIYGATLSAVTYETTPRPGDQVITTSSAYYGPRFTYSYNGSAWVPAGLLVEASSTGNIFINTNVPATQTRTITNGSAYTVSFWGTGSIVLSGAASQTMTGAANTLTTYTFTAGSTSLTATMSGLSSSSNIQLEPGSFATSYMPTPTASSPGPSRAADVVNEPTYAAKAVIWQRKSESTGTTARTYYAPGALPEPFDTGYYYQSMAAYPRALTTAEQTPRLVNGAPY